ncbi:30S ribosomal protein S8 [Candidatus Pacearchaeota archaeon]|nr:30S ribosomal protein S8 [Candidatus Pacearchaeota archaeon]
MSQDVVSDALNMMRNAVKAGKKQVKIDRTSNLLIEILKIMKQKGAVKKYKINTKENSIEVTLGMLQHCQAIKPRFTVKKDMVEEYRRRYLPARDVGTLVISTNKGLVTHEEAFDEQIGGCLIAYFY